MSIDYVKVQDVLKKRKVKYPEFGFLDNSGSVIKIMQWQPKGILSFQAERGFCCKEPAHKQKAESFIKEACNKRADIVITPEYSFPWDVVQEIIKSEKWQPKHGKLYCLGMEGISGEDLKNFIAQNDGVNGCCILTEDINELQENFFFSCLLYLFKSAGKIVCLIQFKTTPASDKWSDLEAKGLTRGKTIYLFKSRKAECYVFSYICADLLNQEIESFKSKISYQECLILHPQLNPKPLHETFEQMRGNYLNYDGQNTRIIGVNWAKDTVLPAEGQRHEVRIEESVSACFYNGDWNNKEKENVDLLTRNKAKGIDLAIKPHCLIWYMPDDEHCMFYTIDCFSGRMLSNVTGMHKEPLGDTHYRYCEKDGLWKPEAACNVCRIDWDWLQKAFLITPCSDGKCANSMLLHFFSILLMGMRIEDPNLAQERIHAIFSKGAAKNTALSTWRGKCQYVDSALKEGILPRKILKRDMGNCKWVLDARGNLAFGEEGASPEIYSVMYVNSESDCIIEKCRNQFLKDMGEMACDDRLIIYYITMRGIRCYEKFYNKDINKPDYTSTANCII